MQKTQFGGIDEDGIEFILTIVPVEVCEDNHDLIVIS